MLTISTLIVLILTTTSCKKEEEVKVFDMVAAQQAIDEANIAFADAFTKGDAVALANCYTSDAKFMPPNAKASDGKAAIQEEMTNFFKGGTSKLELKSVGLWGDENMLIEENTWVIYDKDSTELDHGKSLVYYKKEGDKWKIFRDCYNSDTNGQAPTPETDPVAEENK